MAFAFGNQSGAAGGATEGPALEVIQTEGLGFLAINGEAKVQLTTKWNPAPAPTASLLSVASHKGLVAAAGPDAFIISTTESVRKGFEAEQPADGDIRPFTPQATIPMPLRVSQLSFTADEKYLVLSAEEGGGLAVYDVDALSNGTTQSAFEISTNGEALRSLIPNPAPEFAHFCAVITTNGNLYMANLNERQLVSGANGPTLRSQVSCASWSTRGKQLVAGMADGSIIQMTPDGAEKAHIPKPPSLGDYYVSSLVWLENHVFLVIHNPTSGQDPSVYHIITRQQQPNAQATFTYNKMTDPVEPFGAEKAPHHTVLRLKDFPPNLTDLLLVSSTATESIGLLTRSKTPLASDKPVVNAFTTTEFADDTKRALLPMSEDMTETFPVGTSLDLSAKDKVYKPIPTDEINESPGPLPGLWVLNNDGVLSAWWVVYNESIRNGTTYPGLAVMDSNKPAQPAQQAQQAQPQSAFGASTTTAPAFGSSTTAAPAFGSSAFGVAPSLGAKTSSWGGGGAAAPAFGSSSFGSAPAAAAPAFGAPSALGGPAVAPAFGQSSMIGMGVKASPWASGGTSTGSAGTSGKVFGGGAASSSGGFASFASTPTPFTSFAGKSEGSAFGSLAGNNSGGSIFGSKPAESKSIEVSMDSDTAFPPPAAKPAGGSTFGSSPFVLGTTFKADPKTANDNEEPSEKKGGSLFGSGFGLSLNEPAAAETKDETMESAAPTPVTEKPKSIFNVESTTPAGTPAPNNIFGAPKPPGSGFSNVFGAPKTEESKPKPLTDLFGKPKTEESAAKPNPFAAPLKSETKPNPFAAPLKSEMQPKSFAEALKLATPPKVKEEDTEDKENLANIPEAPLPPETTSKTDFLPGESSASSITDTLETAPKVKSDDAPLPPDFLSSKAKPAGKKAEDAPLPPDTPVKTQDLPKLPHVPWSPSKEEEESDLEEGDVEEDEEEEEHDENEEDYEDEEDEEEEHGSEEDEERSDEEEEEHSDEDDEGSEVASEGSGVDVSKELDQTTTSVHFENGSPRYQNRNIFGNSKNNMGASTFSTISRSEAEPQSRSIFGEATKFAPPLFSKTSGPFDSPSPVRSTQVAQPSLLRPQEGPRTTSTPVFNKNQLLGASTTPKGPPPVDPNMAAQRKFAAKKEAEAQALVDPEDEGIQQLLAADVEPTLTMNEFLVVDSKLETHRAPSSKPSSEVPAAVETLWRDINRMADRLGLNSRSLASFILGHTKFAKEGGRTKEDLETPEDWVLVEASELTKLIDGQLARELEEGRIKDVAETQATLDKVSRELRTMRAKEEDMRKLFAAQTDPEQIATIKAQPLSREQSVQQTELRRAYAQFAKQLAEAEEALVLLRTKIAARAAEKGAVSLAGGTAKVPTVEAVMRTIQKMTTMAEKRSGDVDLLELQIQRHKLSQSQSREASSESREGTPTPNPLKASTTASLRSSTTFTPRDSVRSVSSHSQSPGAFSASVRSRSSTMTPGTSAVPSPSPRKKVSMFTEEERKEIRAREARRKGKLALLRKALEKQGPRVERLGDDD
ncbi:putative nuclear pore complex protein [Neurospora tetraspora]|uniref:Nuclear pore complex protein n=1 Tax=Neurospora tetraspora TaxID=94610 RepID=A0AAE0JSI6_9PEZI|nr:putative nuclear pore complex protein [Neurospora tetraspora]